MDDRSAANEQAMRRYLRFLPWYGAIVFAGAGLFAMWRAWDDHARGGADWRLFESGTRTKGVCRDLVTKKTGSRPGEADYFFTFEFEADGKRHESSEREIESDAYHALKPGAEVDVWYDPADPGKSASGPEEEGIRWRAKDAPRRFAILGGIALVVALGLVVWAKKRAARRDTGPSPVPEGGGGR
ncbi:MAG: DUF3592 domain-containing protein [Planctomycetes bacterium]|nr:DUF3592 domain-containing protein [Planctomycetota bacterium]